MAKFKGLNREMKKKGVGNISRCIRSSRPVPDYAIFLPQIVSFRIGWWVSNTVRTKCPSDDGYRFFRRFSL